MGIALLGLGLIGSIFSPQTTQLNTYGGFSMSQTIEKATAQVGFVDNNNNSIGEPVLNFPIQASSLKCLTYANGAPKIYLGSDNQQMFVSVPNDYNGWGLSLVDGGEWESPDSSATVSMNDNYAEGCLPNPQDAYRASSLGGLMYVDPSSAQLSNDCLYSCNDSSIELGSPTNFAEVNESTIPLVYNLSPNMGWQGKISNIGLTQTLPANIPPGTYSSHMVLSLQLL